MNSPASGYLHEITYSQSRGKRFSLANLWKFQIVSLLDMLEIQADQFLDLMRTLSLLEEIFRIDSQYQKEPILLDSTIKERLKSHLAEVETDAKLLGLTVPAVWSRDFIDRLSNADWYKVDYSECHQRLEKIRAAINAELRGKLFMYMTTEEFHYYNDKALFGEDVESKFPSAIPIIAEAGRCLALGRNTATVFHLMLVLEVGVQEFAKKLSTTINLDRVWGKILEDIKLEIAKLPTETPSEKEFESVCQGIYASLHAVKEAWRNPTMHFKRSYEKEEAQDIWNCSKAFMRRLVEVLP
jgi:hypothetical protein